jgi:hypothetical protein
MNRERLLHPPSSHDFQAVEVIGAGEIDETLCGVVVRHGAISLDPA